MQLLVEMRLINIDVMQCALQNDVHFRQILCKNTVTDNVIPVGVTVLAGVCKFYWRRCFGTEIIGECMSTMVNL